MAKDKGKPAKVEIGVKGGEVIKTTAKSKDDERYYDNLPFTSTNVNWTRITKVAP
jgi:hypothetical protein